ncbi:hypothetical protein VUR80DRAFT_51 [Thermomyces stellatus]
MLQATLTTVGRPHSNNGKSMQTATRRPMLVSPQSLPRSLVCIDDQPLSLNNAIAWFFPDYLKRRSEDPAISSIASCSFHGVLNLRLCLLQT